MKNALFLAYLLTITINLTTAIWCYRCTSSTPGCEEEFNWRPVGYLGQSCPENNDVCVKVIERRGSQIQITRDCLSSLSFRTDIPADHYEGCRPAAQDVRLAHYVNHTTKEHDVKRDYFNNVTYCFCFLDHRCNGSVQFRGSMISVIAVAFVSIFIFCRLF